MGTQLKTQPVIIPERLRPIGDMVNRRHFKRALAMSRRLNQDVLEQRGHHRNVNPGYWQQRAMIELKLGMLDDALASFANAWKHSGNDEVVMNAFKRDLAIYLIKSNQRSIPHVLHGMGFLSDDVRHVDAAMKSLTEPMADDDINHQACRLSIFGRFHYWNAVRKRGSQSADPSLLKAIEEFELADQMWNDMPDRGRNEQWRLNNRVYWFMALRTLRHITDEELTQRDELFRFIYRHDPSRKRRAMMLVANSSREAGIWVARFLA